MKRGLFSLALLASAGASGSAFAQDATDPEVTAVETAPDAEAAPETPDQPAEPEASEDVAPSADVPEEEEKVEAGRINEFSSPEDVDPDAGKTVEVIPLEDGPPLPDYDPALEPEVYWEGDEDPHNPGYVPGYGSYQNPGMNPNLPRAGAMMGGTTAPSGSDTWAEDWAFHFHGYFEAALRAATGTREETVDGQSKTVIHATPITPGRYGDFEATQAVPGPWTQMNFSYGNPYVTATAIIAGFNQANGSSYAYPSSQLGLNDVYLTLRAPRLKGVRLKAIAGAFQDRYGAMGQYSEGLYGHSMIAYTRGTGITVVGDHDLFGGLVGMFEAGIKGTLGRVPLGIEPNDANAFADQQNGNGYVVHGHYGLAIGEADISAHYLHAFSHDDRVSEVPIRPQDGIPADRADGTIDTLGLTMRMVGEPYGHLFVGVGHTIAKDARNVPRVINILNADGGRGLMEEYLGMQSGGNGSMTHAGFQYDMSLQKYLKYPAFFPSNSWDIRASFFATYVHVNSDQESTVLPGIEVNYDNVNKLKMGTEWTYNFIEWAGFSARYDFVAPELANGQRSYHIISPKLLLRTSWLAHEQINIRYTRWFYGDDVLIQTVAPNDLQGLDNQMVALQANMYW
jgi:hypothetical protein